MTMPTRYLGVSKLARTSIIQLRLVELKAFLTQRVTNMEDLWSFIVAYAIFGTGLIALTLDRAFRNSNWLYERPPPFFCDQSKPILVDPFGKFVKAV